MLNKLFQLYWFSILKGNIKRKEEKNTGILLDNYSDRMESMIKNSSFFGGADLVIFGDSNAEEMSDYESLKRFPKLTLNLGIGGTRADHWAQFFTESEVGKKIYEKIKNKKIVINIGGNNVLQGRMDVLNNSIDTLHKLFPKAYCINIPSIYAKLISQLQGRDESFIVEDLIKANKKISEVAGPRLIDIKPFTGNSEGEPFFFVLKDAVHFSDEFDYKIRIPLIKIKVYGL